MRSMCMMLLIAALGTLPVAGASLDGREIVLTGGGVQHVNTPVSLPCDVAEPRGVVSVVDEKTEKVFPATLRNGELAFIPKAAKPGSTNRYRVRIAEMPKDYKPQVDIRQRDGEAILDVKIGGQLFTSYHYANDENKPFLWPVNGEGQVCITRDWPMLEEDWPGMEKVKNGGRDHPHHRSLYIAYGDLNGADCWSEGAKAGFQHNIEVTWGSGDAYGWIRAENVWQDKEHTPIVDETREYRFYATPARGRLFDVTVTFAAGYGDVTFGDTKEGGIVSVRMRPELSYDWGHITNALGDKGEENTWGKPSPWCDYSGELEGFGWRGIAVFDHPSNLRHPTSWHVRKYGLMGANCFGYSYFSQKEYNKPLLPSDNGDYLLKSGESLTFRYRIYVHSGDVEKAAVADRYADYATPPRAKWKNNGKVTLP